MKVYRLVAFPLFLCSSLKSSWAFTRPHNFRAFSKSRDSHSQSQLGVMSTYMETMEAAASKALGRTVKLEPASGGEFSGGGGASTSAVVDTETGDKYFVKSATNKGSMLKAEYLGVKAMADTSTIQTPTPICFGQYDNRAFVLFEYLDFAGGGSQFELGVQLAKMHRTISDQGFGFQVDNTIGATPQPNLPWMDDWADFWDTHRLGKLVYHVSISLGLIS